MFRSIADFGNALEFNGGFHYAQFIRPSIAGTNGRWQDFSQGSGIPQYNAYVGAPLEFTPLSGSGNRGIYTGESTFVTEHKRLYQIQMRCTTNAAPITFILLDYIGFYPLIDYSDVSLQTMDNTNIATRYGNNEGVMAMIVNSVTTTVNSTITIEYVSCDDSTKTVTANIATASSSQLQGCVSGFGAASVSPFIQLGSGCRGIKRITSVTSDGAGDGFGHIVLVKPITYVTVVEQDTCQEINHLNDKFTMPKIENNAFLNYIGVPSASVTLSLRGELIIVKG